MLMIKLIKYFTIIILIPSALLSVYKLYKDYQFEKEVEQSWRESVTPIKKQYYEALQYARMEKEARKKEKQLLSQDHYGGTTPEETLKLFVEALKKKDAKLAAKYYLPWEWKKREVEMEKWVHDESVNLFLDAYKFGKIKKRPIVSGIAIEIYPEGEVQYHYTIDTILNKETGVWKIREF